MKKYLVFMSIVFCVLILSGSRSGSIDFIDHLTDKSEWSLLKGPYLGQKPPGMEPGLFAVDVFPEGRGILNPVFTPDGKEFYFTVEVIPMREYKTYKMFLRNNIWSEPEVDPVLARFNGGEPSVTPDGKYILFNSNRDKTGNNQGHADIWRIKRDAGKSMVPEKLGSGINSKFNDAFPVLSSDGTLYFHSNRIGGEGAFDIYASRSQGKGFGNPVNLGNNVNSKFPEFHPCISPDGSYLIFSSLNKPKGIGHIDLYVSFRGPNGEWTKAVNLGDKINSKSADYMPFVSHDGKYLFFTSTRQIEGVDSGSSPFGKPAIYWVSTEVIEKLRTIAETKTGNSANPDSEFLSKLEKMLDQKLETVTEFKWDTNGFSMTGDLITGIGLFNRNLKEWPSGIWDLGKLKYLYVGSNQLGSIPSKVCNLKELEELWLNHNGLLSLPDCIFDLKNLRKISVYSNNINPLSQKIGNLENLTELHLAKNGLERLPDSIGDLTNLKVLDISDNSIKYLPGSMNRLTNLEVLAISGIELDRSLDFLTGFSKLKRLRIDKNQVPFIPESVLKNSKIKVIIK